MPEEHATDPRDVTVAELCERGLCSEPVEVSEDTPFKGVVEAFQRRPAMRTVAVVNASHEVVGIISDRLIYEAMFLDVFPSIALGAVSDLESALELVSEMRHHTAGELMEEPVILRLEDSESAAFTRIHQAQMSGLPVVDADNRLVGYLDHGALAPLWLERSVERE